MKKLTNLKKLYAVKIRTLLHDPPYKSICIAESIKGAKCNHENEALTLRRIIVVGTPIEGLGIEEYEKIAKEADRLASGIDRWLLELKPKTKTVALNVMANIFNPLYYTELPKENIQVVREKAWKTAREINEILRSISSCFNLAVESEKLEAMKLSYLLLYALLEPLCYLNGLPASLADTRIPTHTIFDHLYAATSMANLLLNVGEENISGYVAYVDFPGIHEFIFASRKAGDFWASSHIISEVMWKLAKKIMDTFGPDTLLSPTPRMNPYLYFDYIRDKLDQLTSKCGKVSKCRDKILSRLVEFFSKLVGEQKIEAEDWLWQPLIPGTLLFVLPKNIAWATNPNNVADKIAELFYKSWKEMIENVKTFLEKGLTKSIMYKVLYGFCEKHRLWDILERPPTGVRIVVIDVGKVYYYLTRCINGDPEACSILGLNINFEKLKNIETKFNKEYGKNWKDNTVKALLFHVIINILLKPSSEILKHFGYVKIPTPSPYWVSKNNSISELMFEKALPGAQVTAWIPCNLCGLEPAVFVLRKVWSEELGEEDYNKEDLKQLLTIAEVSMGDTQIEKDLKLRFRPGEALGPYCFLKRLYYEYAKYGTSNSIFEGKPLAFSPFWSTDDVALKLYSDLISHTLGVSKCKELAENIAKKVIECLKKRKFVVVREDEVNRAIRRLLCGEAEGIGIGKNISEALSIIRNALKGAKISKDTFIEVVGDAVYEEVKEKDHEKLLKTIATTIYSDTNLMEDEIYKIASMQGIADYKLKSYLIPRTRYLIIYSDADNIGKIHYGILDFSSRDYSKALLNLIEKKGIFIQKEKNETIKELRKVYSDVCDLVSALYGKDAILVSASYKTSLSLALMVTALRDVALVRTKLHGLPIFAGGDDLVALAPVDVLPLTLLLRKNFSQKTFFHKFKDTPIVSALPTGRSTSLRIVSIFDVMGEEIRETNVLLEKYAKNVEWKMRNGMWIKDAVLISSSRVKTKAIIPQSIYYKKLINKPIFDEMLKLILRQYIALFSGVLSTSLPEDFEGKFKEATKELNKRIKELSIIIKSVTKRNINIKEKYESLKDHVVQQLFGEDLKILDHSLYELLLNIYLKIPGIVEEETLLMQLLNLCKLLRAIP